MAESLARSKTPAISLTHTHTSWSQNKSHFALGGWSKGWKYNMRKNPISSTRIMNVAIIFDALIESCLIRQWGYGNVITPSLTGDPYHRLLSGEPWLIFTLTLKRSGPFIEGTQQNRGLKRSRFTRPLTPPWDVVYVLTDLYARLKTIIIGPSWSVQINRSLESNKIWLFVFAANRMQEKPINPDDQWLLITWWDKPTWIIMQ